MEWQPLTAAVVMVSVWLVEAAYAMGTAMSRRAARSAATAPTVRRVILCIVHSFRLRRLLHIRWLRANTGPFWIDHLLVPPGAVEDECAKGRSRFSSDPLQPRAGLRRARACRLQALGQRPALGKVEPLEQAEGPVPCSPCS